MQSRAEEGVAEGIFAAEEQEFWEMLFSSRFGGCVKLKVGCEGLL